MEYALIIHSTTVTRQLSSAFLFSTQMSLWLATECNFCYKFPENDDPEYKVTWKEAKAKCEAQSAYLFKMKSPSENLYIKL